MREFFARHDARTGRQAAGETSGDTRADAAAARRAPRAHVAAARSVGARCAADRRPGRMDTARRSGLGSRAGGTASKNTPTTSARITTVPHGKCGAGPRAPRKPRAVWPSSAFSARTDWGFSFGSPGSSCFGPAQFGASERQLGPPWRTAPPARSAPWRCPDDRAAPDPSSAVPDRGGPRRPPRKSDARSDRHPPPTAARLRRRKSRPRRKGMQQGNVAWRAPRWSI